MEPTPEPQKRRKPRLGARRDGSADGRNHMADGADDRGPALRGLLEEGLEDALRRVRGEGGRLGDRASQLLGGLLSELGVVQRQEHEDIELRIAQLEHRCACSRTVPMTATERLPPARKRRSPRGMALSNRVTGPAASPRRLGRVSEIAQASARHGLGTCSTRGRPGCA